MDRFKIEDFYRDNPGRRFPEFTTLKPEEAKSFSLRFTRLIGMSSDATPLAILEKLFEMAKPVNGLDAQSLDWGTLITATGIKPTYYGYIDWYRFDDIDKFVFADLIENFNDIRYNEDVTVFDESCAWLLFIMHYGDVLILKL